MWVFSRKKTKKAARPSWAALKAGSKLSPFKQAAGRGLFCALRLFLFASYAAVFPASANFEGVEPGAAEGAFERGGYADSPFAVEKADLLFLRAERARLNKDPQTALSCFKQALVFQDSPFIRKKLISIYKREGLSSKALFHYRAMLKQRLSEEESYAAHSALSEFFAAQGLFKEALKENNAACQNGPAERAADCVLKKALLLQAAGQPEEALRALKARRQPLPEKHKISSLLLKSQIYWQRGKRKRGRRLLLKAASKSHNAGSEAQRRAARRSIAALFIQRGDLKGAGDYLAEEEDLELLRARAEIFQALNDKQALYAQLKKIEAADILESFEALSMARLLVERGNYQRARLFFEDLLQERQFAAPAHYFLGFIFEKMGKFGQAQSHYLKAGGGGRLLGRQIQKRPAGFLKGRERLKEAAKTVKGLKKQLGAHRPQEA